MNKALNIYFAGELFDHKHLLGNVVLADYIDSSGRGKYKVILPQDEEHSESRAVDIRNKDLELLLKSDVALFNFDGCELDSGTVVEFIFAKVIDMPSVIIRSDFRLSGDQDENGDPWNLMCSGYPRTEKIFFNAMERYQKTFSGERDFREGISILYGSIAEEVISKLDYVTALPSLFDGNIDKAVEVYLWALKSAGSGMLDCMEYDEIVDLINSKFQKNLI